MKKTETAERGGERTTKKKKDFVLEVQREKREGRERCRERRDCTVYEESVGG